MKDFLTKLVTTTSKLYTKMSSIEETLNTTGIISQQEFDSIDSKLTELSGNYLVQKITDLEVSISWYMSSDATVFIQLEGNTYLRFLVFLYNVGAFGIVTKEGDEFVFPPDGQYTSTSEYFDGTYIYLNNNSKIKIEFSDDRFGSINKITFNNINIPYYSHNLSFMVPENVQYILSVEIAANPF